jgi:hypothetical protein
MRYSMPNLPCEFEIPDDWISESGINDFCPRETAYRASTEANLAALPEIVPLPRFNRFPKNWRGFERTRLINLLKGFVAGDSIPPVPVIQLPDSGHLLRLSYRYCIRDGFHRYYGSIIAGFSHLPTVVETLDELLDQSFTLGLTPSRATYSR